MHPEHRLASDPANISHDVVHDTTLLLSHPSPDQLRLDASCRASRFGYTIRLEA